MSQNQKLQQLLNKYNIGLSASEIIDYLSDWAEDALPTEAVDPGIVNEKGFIVRCHVVPDRDDNKYDYIITNIAGHPCHFGFAI